MRLLCYADIDYRAAGGLDIKIKFRFEDTGDNVLATVVNSVLHHSASSPSSDADVSVVLTRDGLIAMAMLGRPVNTLVESGAIEVDGDVAALQEMLSLLDNFGFWFNIVTP